MVFLGDTAFAVELIALVAGAALLVLASKEGASYKGLGKIVGYFTIVASILALLCTGYYWIKYWEQGQFDSPQTMSGMSMMGGMGMMKKKSMMECPMMEKMMKECPMMKKMMGDGQGKAGSQRPSSPSDHESHQH